MRRDFNDNDRVSGISFTRGFLKKEVLWEKKTLLVSGVRVKWAENCELKSKICTVSDVTLKFFIKLNVIGFPEK